MRSRPRATPGPSASAAATPAPARRYRPARTIGWRAARSSAGPGRRPGIAEPGSKIGVRLFQEVLHIAANTLLEGGETPLEARAAQFRDACLREGLILA